ncbi:MAG: hypothetical protein WCH76_00090 [Candidatus Riflemargulisbacteria bacterium]
MASLKAQMIKNLRISNYLFIQEQTIEFNSGMNVFIGESGVGKSLIANILMIPERKPKKEMVGKWGEEAVIEIDIQITGRTHLVKFVISDKHSFVIDGEVVSQKRMKEFWQDVVDVHSQGNYQLLYDSQLEIIDSFMIDKEKETKQNYFDKYLEYDKKREDIKALRLLLISDSDKELYTYHILEINKVSPKINEDDELFVTLKQIKNRLDLERSASKIKQGLELAGEGLKAAVLEGDKMFNAGLLGKELVDKMNDVFAMQEDILWEVTKATDMDRVEDIDDIEDRLSDLENLKTRFKKSLEDIILYHEKIKDMLDNRDYYQARLEKKEKELEEEKKKLNPFAEALTDTRKIVLERVLNEIRESLKMLKLEKTELSYTLKKKDSYDSSGNDELELLIKVNVGSSFVGLRDLSGGETSRVLLAFKSVLLKISPISTYAFDEIDSGVSGDIAFKVMEIMRKMALLRQLIVITHSPMIAVNTDVLFTIQKNFSNNQTFIEVDKHTSQDNIFKEVAILVTDRSSEEAQAYVRSLVRKR